MRYRNRRAAGEALAARLTRYARQPNALVLGLPRGGVPVAAAVAESLALPLDVLVVRKLGAPANPEYALGAIASGGGRFVDERARTLLGVSEARLEAVEREERGELAAREQRFRGGRGALALAGRTAILVDDGLATGSTARAAIRGARALGADRVVLAVPVGDASVCDALRAEADEVVCPSTPASLMAVGMWYDDFRQVTDDEVLALLRMPYGGA